MASRGFINWKTNFSNLNNSNNPTIIIKKLGSVYTNPYGKGQKVVNSNFKVGASVIYDPTNSSHIREGNVKIPFKFSPTDTTVYYSSVENFVKPGKKVSLNASYFGMAGRNFASVEAYKNELINKITANTDIGSDLKTYLLELVNYCYSQKGSNFIANISNINVSNFDWGDIRSYFTELIGPLACVSGLCEKINEIIKERKNKNIEIFIEKNSQPQIDYKIKVGNTILSISAKNGNTSPNSIKPNYIVQKLTEINYEYTKTTEFQVLELLNDNTTKNGPIAAINYISNSNISSTNLDIILTKYNRDDTKIGQTEKTNLARLFQHLKISTKDLTYGKFRQLCEDEIVRWSKKHTHMKIYRDILRAYVEAQDIIFVKSYISGKNLPTFEVVAANKVIIEDTVPVYFKSKNHINRSADKLGLIIG